MQPARKITTAAGCDEREPLRIDAAKRANPLLVQIFARVPDAGVQKPLFFVQRERGAHYVIADEAREGLFDGRVERDARVRLLCSGDEKMQVELLAVFFVRL